MISPSMYDSVKRFDPTLSVGAAPAAVQLQATIRMATRIRISFRLRSVVCKKRQFIPAGPMIAPSVSLRIKIDGCSRGAPELYTNAFIHSRSSLQMNKVRPTHDHNTMTAWIAFLRGINMGGHNKIKMDDLT